MNKAVFLDRDGTVNEEVGYLNDLRQLRLIPGAGEAIRRLNESGFKVVLITNQSGIARGYFTEAFVHETHALLSTLLKKDNARLDGIYYCPHHPHAGNSHFTRPCDCRKPGTSLIERAVRELNINITESFVVGDKWSDVELGQRSGARPVLVLSGHLPGDTANPRPSHIHEPDFTARSITEAVQWILDQTNAHRR